MIDETLIASLGLTDSDADAMLLAALSGTKPGEHMESFLKEQVTEQVQGKLIKGKVIGFAGDDVVIEVGLKSEGLVPKEEFEGMDIKAGDEVEVLFEGYDDEGGVALSKRRADRMLAWQRIVDTQKEGDVVEGLVTKKIKGGLLVDIGVPVFLPASQVDVRRPGGRRVHQQASACRDHQDRP